MTTRNVLAGGAPGPTPPARETDGEAQDRPGREGSGDSVGIKRIRAAIDPANDLACCRLPLTDLGNAERWRMRFGDGFRFCPELGWFWWDGRRWELLTEEKDAVPAELMESIAIVVRAIRNEASLVAASGYPAPLGLSDKELARLEAWADREGDGGRELYLRGDDDGSRALWLEECEPLDAVIGKDELWSRKIAAWAKTSEGGGKPAAMLKWIKGFRGIVVRPDAFDRDPMAINVLNGTLRLERKSVKRPSKDVAAGKSEWRSEWVVKLHPHTRSDLITKLAPVEYRTRKGCPKYDAFLERVQPDEALRRFLHQWGGYSLTGDTSEHKLAFFYGGGRNGKGTWVEAIAHLMGDYAGSIGIESLLDTGGQRRGDQATPDLAELPGVRFLRVSEPQRGMRFNDGLVKQLSGGDPVKARHLNKGFFEYFPDFKITVSGNSKPGTKDISHGFWARMQLVPWSQTIPEDEIDRTLADTLKAESSGILNRLIEGLLDWRREGLIIPDAVRVATQAYRESSDDIGRFLRDLCEISDDHLAVRAAAKELHEFYQAWAEATGGATLHIKAFKSAMEAKGFEQKPSNGMKWMGVRVRSAVQLDEVKAGRWPAAPDPVDWQAPPSPPDDEEVPGWE